MALSWQTVSVVGSLLIAVASGAAVINSTSEYVIILDGGSSHTVTYVYQWPTEKLNGTGLVSQKNSSKCSTVLSNYKSNTSAAGASLRDCLEFAKNEVPEAQWPFTRILLGATAGMRLLALEDATAANAIIKSVQDYVKNNYKFFMNSDDVGLLAPEKEGGYAWTSINLVQKILKDNALKSEKDRKATWGSLDVGGASAQFAMERDPASNTTTALTIGAYGHNYNLLTWSFLCYGHDEAHRRYRALLIQYQNFTNVVNDPCLPIGVEPIVVKHTDLFESPCSKLNVPETLKKAEYKLAGTGNVIQCRLETMKLFEVMANMTATECPFQDKECSFDAVKKRLIKNMATGKFLAKGGLYYVTNDLRTVSNNSFSLNPFSAKGYQEARTAYCRKTNNEIKALLSIHTKMDMRFLLRMCFSSTYNELLLSEIYGFEEKTLKQMLFANTVEGQDVGWALGWSVVASSLPKVDSGSASLMASMFCLIVAGVIRNIV